MIPAFQPEKRPAETAYFSPWRRFALPWEKWFIEKFGLQAQIILPRRSWSGNRTNQIRHENTKTPNHTKV